MKKVIVTVTNDLSTDQRVDKSCRTLSNMGFSVLLVGRRLPGSLELTVRPYTTKRMKLLFRRGPLFYAEYNIRLLWLLITHRCHLIVANDLDTLPAGFLAHRLKRVPLVYDSHEFYTETPELVNRPFVQGIWERIEAFIFPRLTDIITVNGSIAGLYEEKYHKKLHVVRNIPRRLKEEKRYSRAELGLPEDRKIILLQGAGINIQRGAEEAIEAVRHCENVLLLIIGSGDVVGKLKEKAEQSDYRDRVMFLPKMPYEEMMRYTRLADIGLTLDKDTNINYRYSLPNKLFDYIHARIPVLASRLPEIASIVEDYDIGMITENHKPEHIALKLKEMLGDQELTSRWKKNLDKAAEALCWEKEELTLKEVYQKYV
ncbi:glycosyltransferase [Lentimicrobium sp.]|uniref:glycosyltransferase n=1 Tax=Lentimicrobium sp. TaxID=2034841 RepID=UPI002C8AB9FB|nr:glycosyltransferase [Lentimicrobium sp.]HPF63402.1 glycosyltransferase [Lentimicrobium sp.]HPR25990.1 glycosyltransferase [Lentimicrobium sp.]